MALSHTRKRILIAGAAALGTFGVVGASAASLSVTSGGLGAGDTVVSSCDTAVSVAYTTAYNATSGRYDVTGVTVSGIDGCDTRTLKVTLRDAANASLGSGSGTVTGNSGASVSVSMTADAAAVVGAAVVIG
jgi:hypothetical protein